MPSLFPHVSIEMMATRIFNESDHLTYDQVNQIIRQMWKQMCACVLHREPIELEGIGRITVKEHRVAVVGGKVCCMIRFHPDKKLSANVLNTFTPDARYTSLRFTPEQCEEIRRQIRTGEATIKGTAKRVKTDRHTIQKIVRKQTPQTRKEP